jgi:hypothetical protein
MTTSPGHGVENPPFNDGRPDRTKRDENSQSILGRPQAVRMDIRLAVANNGLKNAAELWVRTTMMKLSTVVKKVLRLAEAIQSYWEVELPKRYPNYPFVNPGEEDGPPPPEEKKLRDLLATLPDDYVYKLALIAYLGRGDFEVAELDRGVKLLQERFDNPRESACHILEKASLAEYLSDGLTKLKAERVELDKMDIMPVSPSK